MKYIFYLARSKALLSFMRRFLKGQKHQKRVKPKILLRAFYTSFLDLMPFVFHHLYTTNV